MINELNSEEIPEALNLVWDVFKKYESPDYSPEGTEEFRKCLHDRMVSDLHLWNG